jgi:hypothetical protein
LDSKVLVVLLVESEVVDGLEADEVPGPESEGVPE